MSAVINLGTYRRRRAQARIGKAGRRALRVLGKIALFLPGILVSIAFLGLRLTGIVDCHAAWIILPLLIDIGLWYANARALFAIYKALEHEYGPLKPLRGAPA